MRMVEDAGRQLRQKRADDQIRDTSEEPPHHFKSRQK
jgi:hypothetical protein